MAMKKRLTHTWRFLKELHAEWQADGCFQLAAALSYYTVFSIAPMFAVIITVAGYFLGTEAVTGELYAQIQGYIGPQSAIAIQSMVESINQESNLSRHITSVQHYHCAIDARGSGEQGTASKESEICYF